MLGEYVFGSLHGSMVAVEENIGMERVRGKRDALKCEEAEFAFFFAFLFSPRNEASDRTLHTLYICFIFNYFLPQKYLRHLQIPANQRPPLVVAF